jgi:hypothetical protein
MQGDADNTSVWDDADVFVSFNLNATVPAIGEDFGVDWEAVGFLDGTTGFAESVSETETSHKVWGQGTIKKSYKDTEVMVSFLARERNDTTERLGRPGNHEPFLLALETREGDRVYRKITKEHAVAKRNGDVTDNEDALSGIPLQATILPDTAIDAIDADRYWDIQDSAASGS